MKKVIIDCIDVVNYFAETYTEIKEYYFLTFQSYQSIQDRILNKEEFQKVFDKALLIRSKYNLPFWDCFNVSIFNNKFSDYSFLNHLKFHNKVVNIDVIRRESIEHFLEEKRETRDYLTLSSKVKSKDGITYHIPLLDFHLPVNNNNEIICINILKNLNLKGFLLDSGKSYHFYGMDLITENRLIDLLANALLFAPIIDRAWVAHQLIEKSCALRISKKYSRLPLFVRKI